MRRPDTLDRARKSVDSDKTTHYKPRDEEKSGKSARRVVYPAHIPKDIDKNHTHFVFVKSFACTVCGRPSEGGTGFCKDHDTEDGGMADEWNQRIWRDTMKVRDSLEDYLKGQRFIELLDTYNSGVKNREKWEEHGTSKTKKQNQNGAKQQDVDGSKPPPAWCDDIGPVVPPRGTCKIDGRLQCRVHPGRPCQREETAVCVNETVLGPKADDCGAMPDGCSNVRPQHCVPRPP